MKSILSGNDNLQASVNNIEVQIIYSQEGAPYCEFNTNPEAVCEFIVSTLASNAGYFFADSGYAESFPLFDLD